ncbi:MAG: hypothetical protein JW395_0130 [Nitrospira sp.]|nr:hypothetical protein [Nitrospira sp.]
MFCIWDSWSLEMLSCPSTELDDVISLLIKLSTMRRIWVTWTPVPTWPGFPPTGDRSVTTASCRE